MIDPTKAFSGFAVSDVEVAARFYRDTLGLDVAEEDGMLTLRLGPDRSVLVYPKADHVPACFTILNFPVDDIETAVAELVDRGVRFERYEDFEHDAMGIARAQGGPPIAWFTDPAGNVLSVLEAPGP